MNVKRFAARTSREALALVRQAFGVDAVVLSTKPCAEGDRSARDGARLASPASSASPRRPRKPRRAARRCRNAPPPRPRPQNAALAGAQRELANRMGVPKNEVEADADQLAMSTLSFQDYVRDRMLKRRHAELNSRTDDRRHAGAARGDHPQRAGPGRRRAARPSPAPPRASSSSRHRQRHRRQRRLLRRRRPPRRSAAPRRSQRVEPTLAAATRRRVQAPQSFANAPELHDEYVEEPRAAAGRLGDAPGRRGQPQQPPGHGERAALDEGPDRGALRRPGLHGEAAAPAAPGAARAEAAGRAASRRR